MKGAGSESKFVSICKLQAGDVLLLQTVQFDWPHRAATAASHQTSRQFSCTTVLALSPTAEGLVWNRSRVSDERSWRAALSWPELACEEEAKFVR